MFENVFKDVDTFKKYVKTDTTLRPIEVFEKIHDYLNRRGYKYVVMPDSYSHYAPNVGDALEKNGKYGQPLNASLEGYLSLQEQDFKDFHTELSNTGKILGKPLTTLNYNVILKARVQYVIYEFLRVPSEYRYKNKYTDIPYKEFYEMYNKNDIFTIKYHGDSPFRIELDDLKNENYENIILEKLSKEIQTKKTTVRIDYIKAAAEEYLNKLEKKETPNPLISKGGKRRKSSKKSKKRSKKSSKKSKKRSSKKSTKKRSTKRR